MKSLRLFVLFAAAVPALGHSFLWTKTIYDPGTNYTYSASADFTQVGSQLKIVFTNIATVAPPSNAQVLTGLFFDLASSPTLVKNNVALTAGSSYLGGSLSGVLGDHWAYKTMAVTNQWGNAHYGIGASGLAGTFGAGDTFTGAGGSPNGVDYGLVPTAGSNANPNQAPWVQNSATFLLDLPVGYTLTEDKISNVWFQYGSAPDEFFANVPEPTSMAALALGGIAFLGRKRKKSK